MATKTADADRAVWSALTTTKDGWMYWRLHNTEGHVVGFCRQAPGRTTQYVTLVGTHWHHEPLRYADRYRLDGKLPGFAYLGDPR
jgi:hypothetical protein